MKYRHVRQVCRQFLRGKCGRKEEECRFAHPPSNVSVDSDNMVVACIDFIKNRCSHDPCRYFHPPEHLKGRVYIAVGGVCTAGCLHSLFSLARTVKSRYLALPSPLSCQTCLSPHVGMNGFPKMHLPLTHHPRRSPR